MAQTPEFSADEVFVVFVLGGPGAGKGTQSERLSKDYGFVHLSAGDLLREEQKRPGSESGTLIQTYIREGQIVPHQITIALLARAMRESKSNKFLIDGFPRKFDQAVEFEEKVCVSKFTLFFSCTKEIMLKRLLERSRTSGREDDNTPSILKRLRTFEEMSMPVVEHFRKQGKVHDIDCCGPVDEVHQRVTKVMKPELDEFERNIQSAKM